MIECSCKPYVPQNIDVHSEAWKTTYNRSYYYETAIYHPFVNIRVKRRLQDDEKFEKFAGLQPLRSNSQQSFVPKYLQNSSSNDYYRRIGCVSKHTLKDLHEEYVAHPPRPMKTGPSIHGSSYIFPEKSDEPTKWQQLSPAEEFTLRIPNHCKEGYKTFPPNEPGYTKHLDIYLTTTQSTHCDFSPDQRRAAFKKDKLGPYGPYFHRDREESPQILMKFTPSVPFFGKTSTYKATYDFVPTNLMFREGNINYPPAWKIIEDPPYCTEQCHMGTGWPVRAELDIGTVSGTH